MTQTWQSSNPWALRVLGSLPEALDLQVDTVSPHLCLNDQRQASMPGDLVLVEDENANPLISLVMVAILAIINIWSCQQ